MTAPGHPTDAPFLSVLVPVGTVGEQGLRETLLCLAGQDDTDLEVVLVVPDDDATVSAVEGAAADQPPRARRRVRLVRTAATTPGAVRNAGVAEARGSYVSVLPEGDLVLGSWVGAFHAAGASSDGSLLRSIGVSQEHSSAAVAGFPAVRAVGSPRSDSPAHFSLWQHALEPLTPPAAWAWPRALVAEQGVAYDEQVTDDADWELLVRLAQLAGVVDLETVTSLHRDGSDEPPAVLTGRTAREVMDSRPLVLPPGEAGRLRSGTAQAETALVLAAELETRSQLIRLKDDHIRNIEAQLEEREARLARLQKRLDKRTAQLERLRTRASVSAPVDELTAPASTPGEDPDGLVKRGGWFRR